MRTRCPNGCSVIVASLFPLACGVLSADKPLFHNSGFELGTLEGWTAEGDAFPVQPTKGDNPAARNRETSNHQGQFWIGTFEKYNDTEGEFL